VACDSPVISVRDRGRRDSERERERERDEEESMIELPHSEMK